MARLPEFNTLSAAILLYLVIITSSKEHTSASRRLRKRGISNGDYMVSHWGSWSPWSSCSRSCGGGLAEQTRHCLRRRMGTMVLTGAKQCVGLYKQYKLCNTKPCPEESTDFRTEQCEKFNHDAFMGKFYQWETFIKASSPCELNCRAKGNRFYAKLADKVIDGTRCGIQSDNQICVNGMCKTVGCDGVLGSGLEVDKCGVCGGSNTDCQIFSDTIGKEYMSIGYHTLVTIPAGAMYVNVTELTRSRNYLGLKITGGENVFNGNWRIDYPGNYSAEGTNVMYTRSARGQSTQGEQILIMGPTAVDLDVMMIFQQKNPGIFYEYVIPNPPGTKTENRQTNPPPRPTTQATTTAATTTTAPTTTPPTTTPAPTTVAITTPPPPPPMQTSNAPLAEDTEKEEKESMSISTGVLPGQGMGDKDKPKGYAGAMHTTSDQLIATEDDVNSNKNNNGRVAPGPVQGYDPSRISSGIDRPLQQTSSLTDGRASVVQVGSASGTNGGGATSYVPQQAGEDQRQTQTQILRGEQDSRGPSRTSQHVYVPNPQRGQGTSVGGSRVQTQSGSTGTNSGSQFMGYYPSGYQKPTETRIQDSDAVLPVPGSSQQIAQSSFNRPSGANQPISQGIRPNNRPFNYDPNAPSSTGSSRQNIGTTAQSGVTSGGYNPNRGLPVYNPPSGNSQRGRVGQSQPGVVPGGNGNPVNSNPQNRPYQGQGPVPGVSSNPVNSNPLNRPYQGQGQGQGQAPVPGVGSNPVNSNPLNRPYPGQGQGQAPVPGVGSNPANSNPLNRPYPGQGQGQAPVPGVGSNPVNRPYPGQGAGAIPGAVPGVSGNPGNSNPLNPPFQGQGQAGSSFNPQQPQFGASVPDGEIIYNPNYRPPPNHQGAPIRGGGAQGVPSIGQGSPPNGQGQTPFRPDLSPGAGRGQPIPGQVGTSQSRPVSPGGYPYRPYPGGLPDRTSQGDTNLPQSSGQTGGVSYPYPGQQQPSQPLPGQPETSETNYSPHSGQLPRPLVPIGGENTDPYVGEDYSSSILDEDQGNQAPIGRNPGEPNTDPNPEALYIWMETGLTECSASCAGGVRETIVQCVSENSFYIADDSMCDEQYRPEARRKACNNDPCPPEWKLGEWSACSRTCGEGRQMRMVTCQKTLTQSITLPVTPDQCLGLSKPPTTQSCNSQKSCTSWQTGSWGSCSVECGEGERRRQVTCVDEARTEVSESECSFQAKPDLTQRCDAGPCTMAWFSSEWSTQCSSECGVGTLSRGVICSSEGTTAGSSPDGQCAGQEKPSGVKTCSEGTCGPRWFASEWTRCSVHCGTGSQSREVICISSDPSPRILPTYMCSAPRPDTTQVCEESDCAATHWFMSEWTECSQSCGGGQRTRSVKCLDGRMRPSTECEALDRPSTRQSCNIQRCKTVQPADPSCVDRFSYCDKIHQARLCSYSYYSQRCCYSCSQPISQ